MSAFSDVELDGAITGRKPDGPSIGDQIGPYRLVRALGAGARDRSFEVEHLTTGARGAMRLLPPGSLAAAGGSEILAAAEQALQAIGSRHIVALIDVIEGDGAAGVDAVVTELVQGRTLAQLMAAQGPLPLEQFVPILAQILAALKSAHGALLVHRSLCPQNVLLVNDGDTDELVKLLHFGVAAGLDAAPAAADDPYRSPEQVAGASIDHRTDIYAFGVILYELLCGRLPFEPVTRASLRHEPHGPAPAPSAALATPAGRALDGMARRCLREDPEDRFASVDDLEERLRRLVAEEITEEGSYRVPDDWTYQPAASPLRRWGLVGAVGLLVLGGGGLVVGRMGSPPPAEVLASRTPPPRAAPKAPVAAPAPIAAEPSPAPAPTPAPVAVVVPAPSVPAPAPIAAAAPPPPAQARRISHDREVRAVPARSPRPPEPQAGLPRPAAAPSAPAKARARSLNHEGTVDPFN